MVIAHQGGWDEALFVVVPLVVFGVLLVVASRRADREVRDIDRREPTAPPRHVDPGE